MSLHAEVRERNYGTIIIIKGHFSRTTYKKASFLFKEVLTENISNFALDLSKLEYIDAQGLSVISQFSDKLKKKGITLYAYGMNNEIYDILEVVDLAGGIKLVKSQKDFRNFVSKASPT
jgi:anti-anti-sigma factor